MLTRAATRLLSINALKVVNNVAKQQFVVTLKGEVAVLEYEQIDNKLTLIHTSVPPVFQGKGVGKLLAQFAFQHAVHSQLDVTCKCHFLAKYYKDNSEKYKALNIKFDLE